jgi:hypothetical protein
VYLCRRVPRAVLPTPVRVDVKYLLVCVVLVLVAIYLVMLIWG